MLIVTLPAVHQERLLQYIIAHPEVSGVRYNIGTRSPYTPKETLERILSLTTQYGKKLWIDLKGRQLRITQWAAPQFGRIVLSHPVEVDCPAKVFFRGDEMSELKVVRGNTIYVDPPPRYAVGEGQAINIHGEKLRILGYLTEEDRQYTQSCRELGINDLMLSFVEESTDIGAVREIHPEADLVLKIESPKGVSFAENQDPPVRTRLMAARDDLFINVGPQGIFPALRTIIKKDPQAMVASRIFGSLEQGASVALSDLSDVILMQQMGYRHFMLSDGISHRHFDEAMKAWNVVQSIFNP